MGLTLDNTWEFAFLVIVAGLLNLLGFVLLAPEVGPLHFGTIHHSVGRGEGSPLQGPSQEA